MFPKFPTRFLPLHLFCRIYVAPRWEIAVPGLCLWFGRNFGGFQPFSSHDLDLQVGTKISTSFVWLGRPNLALSTQQTNAIVMLGHLGHVSGFHVGLTCVINFLCTQSAELVGWSSQSLRPPKCKSETGKKAVLSLNYDSIVGQNHPFSPCGRIQSRFRWDLQLRRSYTGACWVAIQPRQRMSCSQLMHNS